MNDTTFVALVALLALFVAFQQWLRHHRRLMIHRERLAALEKGVDLPPFERESRNTERTIQRVLLFAGLVWLSLGIGTYMTLDRLVGQPPFRVRWGMDRVGNPEWVDVPVRDGMQWVGVALAGIGFSHLIVYAVARRTDEERSSQ